jgi:hypothetical protein
LHSISIKQRQTSQRQQMGKYFPIYVEQYHTQLWDFSFQLLTFIVVKTSLPAFCAPEKESLED